MAVEPNETDVQDGNTPFNDNPPNTLGITHWGLPWTGSTFNFTHAAPKLQITFMVFG